MYLTYWSILKTSTSHVTPEYDKLTTEETCDICHYVYKVIRKSTSVFFQRKHFFFIFPWFIKNKKNFNITYFISLEDY